MPVPNHRTAVHSTSGMTLLELLVVAGILSVLMGLGVGFLRRSDGLPEARSAIVGMLRMAALDARTRGLPTEVQLAPGTDGSLGTVTARGLDPVLLTTFDPGQRYIDANMAPLLGGEDYPQGRYGHARTTKAGDQSAALRLQLSKQDADFGDGFALRVDVKLLQRGPGFLLRLSNAIAVQLDEEGRPRVRLSTQDSDGRGGATTTLVSEVALPSGRWCTFEIAADGRRAWIAIDGRIAAEQDLKERLRQQKDDVLEVLPGNDGIDAAVDEVQLFAYVVAQAANLPEGALLQKPVRIAFDSQGEPIAPEEIRLQMASDNRVEVLRIGPQGVLQ